jgi:hypothetical protein
VSPMASSRGGTAAEVPERYRDATPLTWIDARTAPFLVIHGSRDDVVPVEQSPAVVVGPDSGDRSQYAASVRMPSAIFSGLTMNQSSRTWLYGTPGTSGPAMRVTGPSR